MIIKFFFLVLNNFIKYFKKETLNSFFAHKPTKNYRWPTVHVVEFNFVIWIIFRKYLKTKTANLFFVHKAGGRGLGL